MLKLKNISGAFLLMLLMGTTHVFGQNPNTNDTLRYIDKIPHWLSVYQLTAPDYLQAQRKQFKASAYVETYVEAVLDHPAWMFTMLNQFTVLRNTAARNTPHIVFNIRYKPLNDQLTNYQVLLTVTGSTQIPLNFNAITQSANFLGLNGRTFPTPQDASDEVAQAIQEAMRLISREVGNTLSPDLMVKYKNEVFWNGHEILIGKEGDNQITLQPLGKFGVPLSPEQVSWTNASNGVVDMTGLQNKSITLTRLDTAASLTVNIKRRSSFVLDIKTLLRPIVLQVLEEKLATVLDEIVNTRVDSVNNANSVSALVGQVEAGNVPLEGNEVLVPLFAQPLVLSDSSEFKSDNTKARTLRELRRAKAIRQVLRTKVNTRALCNLLIQQPDKLDELLDELLLNSGTLLGELVLNLGDSAVLQTSRNIIITYLNENMTRLAGSNFGMANDEPITVTRVQSATPAMVFDPAKRLYIANNVDFPGKEAFRNELTAYLNALDTPLYVFVNYSQDLSTETYLKRTIGTRPAGLPADAQFVTLTLVNIPGSVQYQIFGSKAGVQVNTSLPAKDFLIGYVKAKDAGVRLEDGIIISQLEYQQFTDEFNERYGSITDSESDCGLFSYASQYYRLYKKFNNKGLAWYGVTIKTIICATAYENCSGKDVQAYFCGFTNALAQELDWISMYEALEGISITEEDILELLACSLREYDTNDSNKNHLGLTLFKCITGMEVGELGDRIRAFVADNWNDPYYHGQATAFILTFISPYKGAVVNKVKKIPLYKIRVDKLDNLATAKNVDELVAKADNLLNGKKGWITKFDQKFINYISQFDNTITNPNNKKTVWRILRDDQLPTNPIVAKSNSGLTKSGTPYTIDGHVKNGGKANTETPYISSWTDKQGALDYALKDGGKTVIEIDLTKIGGRFIDLSNEAVRNSLLTGSAKNFAAASSEFLIIVDEIPINAFKVISK